MTNHWSDALVQLGACADAVAWARTQPDAATAWASCPDLAWLVWIVRRTSPDPRLAELRLFAAACAERVAPLAGEHEAVCRAAVAVVRAWCVGEATDKQLRAARSAAWGAQRFAAWSAADAYAADAAESAADDDAYDDAESATRSARSAAAAAAAADAASDADAEAAYAAERREQLALYRAIVSRPVILAEVAP